MSQDKRFYVFHSRGRFSLMDDDTGWVWKGIRNYATVLKMMSRLNHLGFNSPDYKRLRRLEGFEWEQEICR